MVAVAVSLGSSSHQGTEGAAESNGFHDYYARNDTHPSDQFVYLREVASAASNGVTTPPWMSTTIFREQLQQRQGMKECDSL